jgi:hypothetical protein
MRIPFPERIPYSGAAIFTLAVAGVQRYQHTGTLFMLGCAAFTMIMTAAFNLAGGLRYVSGGFILFNGLLTLVFGILAKIGVGEAGDSGLYNADLTIAVYVAGAAGFLLAAAVTRKFRPRQPLLAGFITDSNIKPAYIVLCVIGLALFYVPLVIPLPTALGYLWSSIAQVNFFLPVGILFGVIACIRESDGRRTASPFLVVVLVLGVVTLIFSFSKQSMFTPIVAWVLGCAYMRVRIRPWQLGVLAGVLSVAFYYGIPYSQYGREFESQPIYPRTAYLLTHLNENRATFAQQGVQGDVLHYYQHPLYFMDRLTMVPIDDALVRQNSIYGEFGWAPFTDEFKRNIPSILWPDRPDFTNYSAIFGVSIGVLPDDDTTTGISFSPTAEAYRLGGWVGVLLVEAGFFCCVFLIADTVFGDSYLNPLTLFAIIAEAHLAPEAGLNGQVGLLLKGQAGVVAIALGVRYVFPVIASAFSVRGAGTSLLSGSPVVSGPAVALTE